MEKTEQQIENLLRRLARLEAIDAIKQLKATYFLACDTKQPDLMRDCFAEGELTIDYGPVGQFNDREELVALFAEVGCHNFMLEMHHGHNPIINLIDEGQASGSWELCYQLINTKDKTLTQLGLIYRDQYCLTNTGWKIQTSITENVSTLVLDISGDNPVILQGG